MQFLCQLFIYLFLSFYLIEFIDRYFLKISLNVTGRKLKGEVFLKSVQKSDTF